MEMYFGQNLAVKMGDDRQSDTHGYESVATSTGAVNSLPDYYESLKVRPGELQREATGVAPEIQARPDFHRQDCESLTTLAMFRYPRQESATTGVGHNKHTDIGTLTFLLCEQWGLQVLCRDPDGWRFVAPKPGHAVINVGDTLCFLSSNRVRSAVHRVIPKRGLQHEDRYSIAYFLRAANETQFIDSTGRQISAEQWHKEKFNVFRETHEEQGKLPILTGGDGAAGGSGGLVLAPFLDVDIVEAD
ncbi:hypothetical protein FE257_007981 [Aspergillus nanangensis]|uniref:Fe2OG dioxygenase domain-containing protein n=1 Tax=Aspergillus nanangensis TaxID=2582783 RepID=A0AAD4GSZ2_ASPNN|nr:hypothetical protein FE257_007981 [Aspergillus nanangensis]